MKAQQRHQLQTNALADRVGRLLTTMKSSPRSTSPLVWAFLLLTLGTIGVWQYLAHAAQTERSALWAELNSAEESADVAMLFAISMEHRGIIPGRSAGFDLARMNLADAQRKLNSIQRSEAITQLKDTRERYEKLAQQCADSPLLAQEALMGVASASESLVGTDKPEQAKEELEHAISDYKKLAATYPDSYFGQQAAQRASRLEERLPEVAKFYEELGQLTAHKKKEIKPPEQPTQEQYKASDSKGPDVPKLEVPQPLEIKPPEAKGNIGNAPGAPKLGAAKAPGSKAQENTKESKPPEPKKP